MTIATEQFDYFQEVNLPGGLTHGEVMIADITLKLATETGGEFELGEVAKRYVEARLLQGKPAPKWPDQTARHFLQFLELKTRHCDWQLIKTTNTYGQGARSKYEWSKKDEQ